MCAFAASQAGDTLEVLVETEANTPGYVTGFADNYTEVSFPGSPALRGKIVRVKVTGVDRDGRATGHEQ